MSFLTNIKSLFGSTSVPSSASSQTAQAAQPAAAKKVLIVEDEATLADALEAKFQLEGFQVFKAANGQIGLDMAVANKPDAILLDLQMPVMDGNSMLVHLREMPEFKNLPVIVLTNAGNVDNIHETQTLYNARSFLIKSNVTPDAIVTEVKKYI